MNLRKKGTGSEVNITSTMVLNSYTAGPYAHILGWYSVVFYLILILTIIY
jgi:hypothetical protein